jgi:hypothetical protein
MHVIAFFLFTSNCLSAIVFSAEKKDVLPCRL